MSACESSLSLVVWSLGGLGAKRIGARHALVVLRTLGRVLAPLNTLLVPWTALLVRSESGGDDAQWTAETMPHLSTDEIRNLIRTTAYDVRPMMAMKQQFKMAGEMMAVVAEYFRGKGLKTIASCSYANAWLNKNRETYPDIISNDIDEQFYSCSIDGEH